MRDADYLEKLKTRWRRWLGQKTRADKPYWTTLLSSFWLGWASGVLSGHTDYRLSLYSTRWEIKAYYLYAIECANLEDLARLDDLYCTDLFERKHR